VTKPPLGFGGEMHLINVGNLYVNGVVTLPNLHLPTDDAKKFLPSIVISVPPSFGPILGEIFNICTPW
jgi:hypothetical protein